MSLAFETPTAIQSADRGVTARAVLLGLVLVCAEVAVITFSEPVARSSSMNVSHFPVGFFMWFVVVVLGLNPILKWIYPGYMLSRSELLTVAAMGLIGAHIPGSGLLGFFSVCWPRRIILPLQRINGKPCCIRLSLHGWRLRMSAAPCSGFLRVCPQAQCRGRPGLCRYSGGCV